MGTRFGLRRMSPFRIIMAGFLTWHDLAEKRFRWKRYRMIKVDES